MTTVELGPRRARGGFLFVWAASLLAGIAIAIFVPQEWRSAWMTIALGGAVLLSFAVQLWYGQTQKFIQRVSLSILVAFLLLGVVTAVFGLAALLPL